MHECPECGQACDCDGEDTWFDFPYNLDCTHDCEPDSDEDMDEYIPNDERLPEMSQAVTRDAQLRIGADDAGQNGNTQATYHECGNCGVPRFAHGVILEACPNCGDDETDLSLIDKVP